MGHPGGIGITFGRNIETALFSAVDHIERKRCLPKGHAGDVDDVQRGARGSGVAEDFLERIHQARFHCAGVPHMDVYRGAALGRQGEDIVDLFAGGFREVGDAHADAESALAQALAHIVANLFGLGLRSRSIYRIVAGQEGARIVHDGHARRDVAGGARRS